MIQYGGAPIIWISKLQTAKKTSSAGVELCSLSECVRGVEWVKDPSHEIRSMEWSQPTVYQDDRGATSWTEHVQDLWRFKHLELCYHYICSVVETCIVKVLCRLTKNNLADSLKNIFGIEMPFLHCAHFVVDLHITCQWGGCWTISWFLQSSRVRCV